MSNSNKKSWKDSITYSRFLWDWADWVCWTWSLKLLIILQSIHAILNFKSNSVALLIILRICIYSWVITTRTIPYLRLFVYHAWILVMAMTKTIVKVGTTMLILTHSNALPTHFDTFNHLLQTRFFSDYYYYRIWLHPSGLFKNRYVLCSISRIHNHVEQ